MPDAPAASGLTVQQADAAVRRLWKLQEDLRAEVIPSSRPLQLSGERLKRVLALLWRKDGIAPATEDDCAAVLRAIADKVRRDPVQHGEWFNGETNWRPANFDRVLGSLGALRPDASVDESVPASVSSRREATVAQVVDIGVPISRE